MRVYSEQDLQSAISAGAISPEAADALRLHVQGRRTLPMADEENFRLVTGFNDIFVAIACLLVISSGLYAVGFKYMWAGGLIVAAVSWIMAEMFTRKRRMALPSIILLMAFVLGLALFSGELAALALPQHLVTHHHQFQGRDEVWSTYERYPWQDATIALCAAIFGMAGAIAHWLRFRVSITIAAGMAALVLILLASIAATTGLKLETNPVMAPAAFACGIAVFAFAMRWDLLDRDRLTQRADIAFWLHLLAAPLIAHPLFFWVGALNDNVSNSRSFGVLAIYVVFAFVALVVDRRALLVSALLYVLVALNGILTQFGSIGASLAITTLIIGCALLALSIFWASLRRNLVSHLLPKNWQDKLPMAA